MQSIFPSNVVYTSAAKFACVRTLDIGFLFSASLTIVVLFFLVVLLGYSVSGCSCHWFLM